MSVARRSSGEGKREYRSMKPALPIVLGLLGILCGLLSPGLALLSRMTAGAAIPFNDDVITGWVLVLVGLFLVWRSPGNAVGGALILAGFGIMATFAAEDYGRFALLSGRDGVPLGTLAAGLASSLWTCIIVGFGLVVLLFPSGRMPSGRWRFAARFMAGCGVIASILILLTPSLLQPPFEAYSSPFAIEALRGREFLVYAPEALMMLITLAATIDILLRFRRSRGVEREQFQWLALAMVFVVVGSVMTVLEGALYTVGMVIQVLGFIAIPVAIAISVLRYRLYDIDRVLNRTLVYAMLTATLAVFYLGLVVGLQAIFQPVSGGSDLSIALTTLIVAALFMPVRRRVQTLVDRRFNRRAYDAARTLDAFGARLRQHTDLDTLRYELLAVVDETMEPARVSLWLRSGTSR